MLSQFKVSSQEDAVSAVISVVLMVAITVILAAVIATFVFGMAGNIPTQKTVGGKVSHTDQQTVTVVYYGGPDAGTCTRVKWVLTKANGAPISSFMMVPATGSILTTGTTKTFRESYSGKKRVLATAYFLDGTQQVILDNTF